MLTLSTIYFLIIKITDQSTWIDDIVTGWINHENKINTNVKIPETITWFLTNYAYSALLLLPVFSLASYLSFLKFGKNFLEHIVIGSYVKGQQAALYSLFAIGKTFIEGDAMDIFAYLIATLYTFWVFWQFFSKGNRAINILRSILTHILYFIFGVGVLIVLFETNIVK